MLAFFKNLAKGKLGEAGRKVTETIVAWDPQAATEAEIDTMLEQLEQLTREVAKAQADYEREKAESDAASQLYDKRLQAATILDGEVARLETENPSLAAEKKASLEKLLNQLEEYKPEVEREAREAKEAKEMLDSLTEAAAKLGGDIKKARSVLKEAQRNMEKAQRDADTAKRNADRAAALSGIKDNQSTLNTALDAMNRKAAAARETADAANMRAKLLGPTKQECEDTHIAEALAEAEGKPATVDLSSRLAALKRKPE